MVGESERTLLLYLLRAGFAERGVELCSGVLSFIEGRGGRFVAAWLAFFLRGALESGGAVFWGAVAAVYGERLRGGVWRCDAVFLFCWGRLRGVVLGWWLICVERW
jgi:hypothetical protein